MDVHPWMDKVEHSCPKNHAQVNDSKKGLEWAGRLTLGQAS